MAAHEAAIAEAPPEPLDAFVQEPGCSYGIDFTALEVGAVVHVHTTYSCYRLMVVDPEEKRARVTGGRLFPESTEVRIEGATAGGSAIKPGWIGIGLRLEMASSEQRVTTSMVQSLTLDPPPSSMVC